MEESTCTAGVAIYAGLPVPSQRGGEYLATMARWGELHGQSIPIPDCVRMLASLCKQNEAALLKIVTDAVLRGEVAYWGLTSAGEWVPGMLRVLIATDGKPHIGPSKDGARTFRATMNRHGLHLQAMAVKPEDLAALMVKRQRKVPAALAAILPQTETLPAAPAPCPPPAFVVRTGSNVLDGVITVATRRAGVGSTATNIWVELENMARRNDRPPPLADVTSGGIRYFDGGRTKTLTRKAFSARLARRAPRRPE